MPTSATVSLSAGRAVYEQHCAACHGVNGDGNGPAAVWLYPKPRNYSAGLFKIQSTPAGSLPTDDDLLNTITRGMPGSSMPSFTYLSDQERREAVAYVKYLTAYTDNSGKRINRFEEAATNGLIAKPVEVPPETPVTLQELTLGRDMFKKMQCFLCHGPTGAGDGEQVPTLKDAFGLAIRPRDFNTGMFRGGHTGPDLYRRIYTGLGGTPMVPYGDAVMKPAERWALVHFVQSLRRTDVAVNDLLTPEDGAIRVKKIAKLPIDPMDQYWESLDPVRVPLNPLWPEPQQVYAVAVSAVTDGRKLAVLLQWRDELPQNTAIRVQDFQDAAALQFSMSGNYGFLGMGDAKNPVNLWQWKAGWQAEAEGHAPTVNTAYPSMHSDTYFATSYSTAASAGNVISQPHKSPIEDANARGFGSFKSQPLAGQNVQGKGLWHDGFWNVVFVRDLKSKDAEDVKFARGKSVPVAFAIWNGEQHDRNGRKMVSNWYQLVFE
ncbi:MAG: c-type cytochrome [Verrucomicrobia bacterium]|nr:c-type cytochrome [Verrucomicrobiota bacterium]